MEFILISILFIIQLLTIFWIVILNTKLTKFKDLEQQQRKVIEEMDNSIGAYLLEMKDENDRLLQEIQQMNAQAQQQAYNQQSQTTAVTPTKTTPSQMPKEKVIQTVAKTAVTGAYEKHIDKSAATLNQQTVSSILNGQSPKSEQANKPLTFEEKVKQMHQDGLSIEQIAKNTNKGKTEIELLLKFSS